MTVAPLCSTWWCFVKYLDSLLIGCSIFYRCPLIKPLSDHIGVLVNYLSYPSVQISAKAMKLLTLLRIPHETGVAVLMTLCTDVVSYMFRSMFLTGTFGFIYSSFLLLYDVTVECYSCGNFILLVQFHLKASSSKLCCSMITCVLCSMPIGGLSVTWRVQASSSYCVGTLSKFFAHNCSAVSTASALPRHVSGSASDLCALWEALYKCINTIQ